MVNWRNIAISLKVAGLPQNFGCELDANVGCQIPQNHANAEDEGNYSKGYSGHIKQVGDQRPSAIYDDIEEYRCFPLGRRCHGQ